MLLKLSFPGADGLTARTFFPYLFSESSSHCMTTFSSFHLSDGRKGRWKNKISLSPSRKAKVAAFQS